MNSDEQTQVKPLAPTASGIKTMLGVGLALLAAGIIYSLTTGPGWLLAPAAILFILAALSLFDMTRAKNKAWRSLSQSYAEPFGEITNRKNFATGSGQVGDYSYFGLRCFGTQDGIEISRIISAVNPPLYIPWSAITKIDTFPNLLTGRKDFETDMQSQIILSDQPELSIEVPWLAEYRQLLPKSVKYRSIKLSKK